MPDNTPKGQLKFDFAMPVFYASLNAALKHYYEDALKDLIYNTNPLVEMFKK
jgi:hypothetical protein